MASGDASLAGAEFTFRYYDGQYATAAETEASGAPTRTWAFKTNEKGRIRIMDESLKVSGDDLFYNSMGQITLPIGTLLIQETKAPEGYLIDPTVYVRNITPDGTLEAVNSYNAPTVSEQVVTGRIQIVKHTDTGTTKVETPEVGATFNIYLASAGSYDAAPANARAQFTIDKDGFAVSPDLPYGLYTVEQTSGWEGSRLMEPFTVKIDENGKTYSYIINNERFYSYLKVVKVDAITGEAIPAAGIGFQIIDPQGQKLEWWGADTWYTDGSGVMKLPCELEYGRGYQAVEVVAPSGYVLADKPFLFDVLPENAAQEDGLTVITLTAPNSPTQISVAKVDYQGNFVPGATLQLLDKDGNVAAQWVTENTPHTLTITSWDWAEKDRAFEIIFEVKDLSLNREPGYTFRFRCGDSHYRYKIYRDLGDLLVVRVSGVSSRFAQVAMTVKAGSASRSIYMDDRTMAHVERLEERSDAAYRIHAVEGKAAGHRLALQQLEQQTEEKNADLRLAYEKLEALQASKADKTPQQQEEIDANLRTMAEKQGRLQNELEDMMLRKQALQAQLEQEEQLLARMQEGGDGA